MDKFDFMSVVTEQFEGLQSEEEIELRAKKMMQLIIQYKEMAKGYLNAGIL